LKEEAQLKYNKYYREKTKNIEHFYYIKFPITFIDVLKLIRVHFNCQKLQKKNLKGILKFSAKKISKCLFQKENLVLILQIKMK
jgi:hypothetical protein